MTLIGKISQFPEHIYGHKGKEWSTLYIFSRIRGPNKNNMVKYALKWTKVTLFTRTCNQNLYLMCKSGATYFRLVSFGFTDIVYYFQTLACDNSARVNVMLSSHTHLFLLLAVGANIFLLIQSMDIERKGKKNGKPCVRGPPLCVWVSGGVKMNLWQKSFLAKIMWKLLSLGPPLWTKIGKAVKWRSTIDKNEFGGKKIFEKKFFLKNF